MMRLMLLFLFCLQLTSVQSAVPTFAITSSVAIKGQATVTLSCVITADSLPDKYGFKPDPAGSFEEKFGAFTAGKMTLKLVLKKPDVDESFKCFATVNVTTTESKSINNDVIEVATTTNTIESGSTGTIVCTATGYTTNATTVKVNYKGVEYAANSGNITYSTSEGGGKQIVTLKVVGMTADATLTCKYTFATNSVTQTAFIDVIALATQDVAVIEGTTATILCKATGVSVQPTEVQIKDGSTVYKKDSSPAVTFRDQSNGNSVAEVKLATQSVDKTFTCTFVFASSNITKTQALDAVTMVMPAKYTETGTGISLTCTVAKLKKDPSGGLTFQSGSTKWDKTESDSAVVFTDIAYTNKTKVAKLGVVKATSDGNYSCIMKYGVSVLTVTADLDVFSISSSGYTLTSGMNSTIICTITGVATKPTSVGWGDVMYTHYVTKDTWISGTGTWNTSLLLEGVTSDTNFTCTYTVDGKDWTKKALADVVVFTTKGFTLTAGKSGGPTCTVTGSKTKPPNMDWYSGTTKLSGSSYTIKKSEFKAEKQNLTLSAVTNSDKNYTCHLAMATNTLTKNATVDVVVITYEKVVINNGTAAPTLTCKTTKVIDASATTMTWIIGGKSYKKGDTTTVTDNGPGDYSHQTILKNLTQTADFTVTCKIAYSTNNISTVVTHDVLELTSAATATTVIQKGNDTSIWCQLIKAQDTYTLAWKISATTITNSTTNTTYATKVVTDGKRTTLSRTSMEADVTYTCHWDYTTYTFNAKPSIDVIETIAIGAFVVTGAKATVTCEVKGAASTAELNFEIGKNYTKAKSETKDGYTIAHGKFGSEKVTSTVIGTFSNDTTVNCYATVGNYEFKMNSAVDTFIINGTGYTTVKTDGATISAQITGSMLIVKSQHIQWSTNLAIKNTVKWDGWQAATESHKTDLSVSSVSQDITYTCTFTVNGKGWPFEVPIDVIEKKVTVTSVRVGSATTLMCGFTNSSGAPTNVWYTTAGNSNKINKTTNATTGLSVTEVAYNKGAMSSNLKIAKASADTVYTCFTEFKTNTLSWNLKSDTFTLATSSYVTVKGTTASVTCTVTGTDVEPSAWKWVVNGTDYTATKGSMKLTKGAYANETQSHVMEISSQAADENVTCKVTVDGKEYTADATIDVIEVNMISTTVLTDAAASISCKVTGYNGTTAPTDIWWNDGSNTYKASTTTAGYKVVKSSYSSGAQEAKLNITKAAIDQTYTCSMQFPLNKITRTSTVDVYTIVISGIYEIPVNNYAVFTCTIDKSKTKPQKMSWTIDKNSVPSPMDNATYKVTEVAYSNQMMKSILNITKLSADTNIMCLTKIEFDGETPKKFIDVYNWQATTTMGFNNYNSTAVMLIKNIEKNIDKSRIRWGLTNSFSALSGDYTSTNVYNTSTKSITIRLAIKTGAGNSQEYHIKLDGVAAYTSKSVLDIGKITIDPTSINIINGTSYNFTVTIAEFTADYTSKVHWALNSKTINPTSNAWNSSAKTLTSKAHAVGATAKKSILKFTMKNEYASAVNTADIDVAEMTVTEHTRITGGETLSLTCKFTNIRSNITTKVWWNNRGKEMTGVTPTYNSAGKTFQSVLKIEKYNHTDQVYTCVANVSKTVSTRKSYVWQFVYFKTSQAVAAKTVSTVLTCKVSGAKSKPSAWTWTPDKTSILFKRTDGAWNASEGSQESYLTIPNIAHDSAFICSANISGYADNDTKLSLQADLFDFNVMGDMKLNSTTIKFVQKGKAAIIPIDLINLKLNVNVTAEFGGKKYYTWKNESGYSFEFMKEESKHGMMILKVLLKIDAFSGTSGIMKFQTSRMTPPEVTPPAVLSHLINKNLTIKFFSATVTENAIVTTGDSAQLTCEVAGMDVTGTIGWYMLGHKAKEYGKLNVTVKYDKGNTTAVLTTPAQLSQATKFECMVGVYSFLSQIWYLEKTGQNATTLAGTATNLGCGMLGTENEPTLFYWTDKNGEKYDNKTTITGYKVENSLFNKGKGEQVSVLNITNPTEDQTFTCVANVNSGLKTATLVYLDIISISGKDVELLKGGTAVLNITVSGINSGSKKDIASFSNTDRVYDAAKSPEIKTSEVVNGIQTFTLTLKNQTKDDTYVFHLKTEQHTFNKTLKVDTIEMTITHGQGYANTETTLTCAVSGASGDPNFLWSVDGVVQSGNADTESAYSSSAGTKNSVWETGKRANSTTYTCKMEIVLSKTTYTMDTYYNVYSLSITDATIVSTVIPTLTCIITGSNNSTNNMIEWYNGSNKVSSSLFTTTYGATQSKSVLKPGTTSDGTFKCKIAPNSVVAQLDRYTIACTTGSALYNTTATIVCTLSNLQQDPSKNIIWNATKASVVWDNSAKTIKASLTISALVKDMSYLLTFTSQDGNKQTIVTYAKVLGISMSPTTVISGVSYTLSCKLKGSNKTPTDKYFMDGSTKVPTSDSKVTASSFSASDGTMTMTYISTTTSDKNLTCVFKVKPASEALNYTTTAMVDVVTFTASSPVMMAINSGSQNITCQYGASTSQRTISWTKSGSAVTMGIKATASKNSGTSVLTVKNLSADTTYNCMLASNDKVKKVIVVDVFDVTITAPQYKALGGSATILCKINEIVSKLSKNATFGWKDNGATLAAGSGVTITTDNTNKQNSTVKLTSIDKHHNLECTVTENGYTIIKQTVVYAQYVETSITSIAGPKNVYRFTCKLTGFTNQPVPTYWLSGSTKYYPEKEAADIAVTTDAWSNSEKKGEFHLMHTESSRISTDLTYTCVVVTGPSTNITKTTTLDHINATVSSTQYIMKGKDLVLTSTFSGVVADYSSYIHWHKGSGANKTMHTKAKPNGYIVTTAYNSSAKTLKTTLTIKAYTIGDQTIMVMINRNDTDLHAMTSFSVDQFEMSFDNVYLIKDGDVSVECGVTNTAKSPKSITISSGSLKFTQSSKSATSMSGKFGSVTADGTMKCVLDMDGSTVEQSAKIEKLSITISAQTWSSGNAMFSATLDSVSFDVESDVHWFISGKEVKTGIQNKYTTGIKIASVLTITGTHEDGEVKLTVGGKNSAASATKTLEYYYLNMAAVRVEKSNSVTITCALKSITSGLKTLKLKSSSGTETSVAKYMVSLVLEKVTSSVTMTCTATFSDNVLTETSGVTVYAVETKVNGAAYSDSTKWVKLNAKSNLICDMSSLSPASDKIKSLVWTTGGTTLSATTTSSNNTYSLYEKTMTKDQSFTCTFNFDGHTVKKVFSIIVKGCAIPTLKDGSYAPTTSLPKIAPSTVLAFTCKNSTKYDLKGNSHIMCTNEKADSSNLKYNGTYPTCQFVGDCTDVRTSFTNGEITPSFPFSNDKKYTFKCNTGYVLFGTSSLNCKGDSWSGKSPTCEAVIEECNINSWGKAYGNRDPPYVQGDEITVFCTSGYTNAGAAKLTCLKNGWNAVANCTQKAPNECAKMHPSSGEMVCKKNDKIVTTYTENTVCTINCGSGYKAVGNTNNPTCDKNGTWSVTTIPSCAQITAPTIRKAKIVVMFGATYCVNSAQVGKMKTSFTSALTSTYTISCLAKSRCEISDFTCSPSSNKFTITFNLKQTKDMSNTTVLQLSSTEIETVGKTGITITVAAKKKRHVSFLVKRSTEFSYSSTSVSKSAQISTCPSNTILENNLCLNCPKGYYKKSTSCDACPVATYNELDGAIKCTSCTNSQTTLNAGATTETLCTTLCIVPYVKHVKTTTVPPGLNIEENAVVNYVCDDDYHTKGSSYYVCDAGTSEESRTPVCEKDSNLIMYLIIGICVFFLILVILILIVFCCGIKVKVKVKDNKEEDYILENKYNNAEYSNDGEYKPRQQEISRAQSKAGSRPYAGSRAPSTAGAPRGDRTYQNRTADSRI